MLGDEAIDSRIESHIDKLNSLLLDMFNHR